MGFGNHSKSVIFNVSGLTMRHIKCIIGAHNIDNEEKKYCIDVDMSWVLRKLGIGLTVETQIKKLSQLLQTIARDGFIVTPVCDNNFRHHSKRDSISRNFKREKARINALFARCKSISLSAEIRSNGGNITEEQEKERKLLNNHSKKLEDASFVSIPDNFTELLQNDLDIWNASVQNINGDRVN